MSRRKIDEKDRKTVRVTFRMDSALAKTLVDRAEEMGLGFSEYLRNLAETRPMVRLETKQNLQKIKYELSTIGTNMQEIGHVLNGNYYHYAEDAKRAEEALGQLRRVLEKILDMY